MPANANVFLHYGPYDSCGNVAHREDRLEGLQDVLGGNGHKVTLKEIPDRDAVEIWVNGQLVFNCSIQDLDYGGDGKLDKLCDKALNDVNKAF